MSSSGQQTREATSTSVVTRPPLIHLAFLLLGFALDRLLPLPFAWTGAAWVYWMVGGGLILAGAAIMAAGARNFSRAATPVQSSQPVRALVASGIHGWSRNPIYVGMFFIYAGIGIAARSPWILVLALPLAIIMRTIIVAREEAYMERHFGDAYRDYKAHVRRWL